MTKKFARRFVMVATVITDTSHRYVVTALGRETHWSRQRKRNFRENKNEDVCHHPRLGFDVAASVQFAAAAQRHHDKPDRVVVRQQPNTINSYAAWPAPAPAPASSYGYAPSYYSGGYSAPAGH